MGKQTKLRVSYLAFIDNIFSKGQVGAKGGDGKFNRDVKQTGLISRLSS